MTRLPFKQLVHESQQVAALRDQGLRFSDIGAAFGRSGTWAWGRYHWYVDARASIPRRRRRPPLRTSHGFGRAFAKSMPLRNKPLHKQQEREKDGGQSAA